MYISTRGKSEKISAAQAIKMGLATDGGLFVPEVIPSVTGQWIANLVPMSYQERAEAVLKLFLEDYTEEELTTCIANAYSVNKFDHAEVAPIVSLNPQDHILELWHGPTSAFKDMALQLLPQLLSKALYKTQEKDQILILVATSGDTGKAALEGFMDVAQTSIVVFYPQDGVSEIQKLQMKTQKGRNVAVVAVKGNFDDAQTGVKRIFSDNSFNALLKEDGIRLSSANSINWGRLVPQIVYYFSAYADLVKKEEIRQGDPIHFVVPTGNFGNILAGYYAKIMGLPIHKLICASNSNNVLTEFLQTGIYNRKREFYKTASPSMDILISSNLERLLYYFADCNTQQVSKWMEELKEQGYYTISKEILLKLQETFWADWVNDKQTLVTINDVYSKYNYVLDPHTAVAWKASEDYRNLTGDQTPHVIVSTASPFKFNENVLVALGGEEHVTCVNEFDALRDLSQTTGWKIPANLASLEELEILHHLSCDKENMDVVIRSFVKSE